LLALRDPFATAKAVATLDYLSGGRFTLEVGVGWMRDEYDIVGMPFERRGKITDDKLELLTALLADRTPFAGGGYNVPPLNIRPLPVQLPFPIYIGSGLSAPAFRRVARFGAGWTPIGIEGEHQAEALQLLAEAMGAQGRDITELDIQGSLDIVSSAETRNSSKIMGQLDRMIELGFTSVSVDMGALRESSMDDLMRRAEWFSTAVLAKLAVSDQDH